MNINLYRNRSDNRVINKDITLISTYNNVHLKDDTDLANPVFIFDPSFNLSGVNYLFAPTLNRYYYIENVTLSQQRQLVSCRVDVLMTYKTYLLAKSCILGRSTSKFNTYQVDTDIPQDNENNITTLPFPHGFEGESLVLIVAGGANSNGGD